jgi:hypothetical protein
MSNRQLLLGAQSQAKRDARVRMLRLLDKLAIYAHSTNEFLTLREDVDTIKAVASMWEVMRHLRTEAKDLEALLVDPPPEKDMVPDVDPPARETKP